MATQTIERRHNRRIELETVQVEVRKVEADNALSPVILGSAQDVSLSGVFAKLPASCGLKVGDRVNYAVSIGAESRKQFPFTRILGQGWVARVIPPEGSSNDLGVAIAFAANATPLSTIDAH